MCAGGAWHSWPAVSSPLEAKRSWRRSGVVISEDLGSPGSYCVVSQDILFQSTFSGTTPISAFLLSFLLLEYEQAGTFEMVSPYSAFVIPD